MVCFLLKQLNAGGGGKENKTEGMDFKKEY